MCGGIPLLGSCWTFSIFVLSTGDQSQGFLHMRGVLYRWAPSTPQQVGYIAYLTPNRSPTTARTVLRFSAYLGGRTASTSQLLLGWKVRLLPMRELPSQGNQTLQTLGSAGPALVSAEGPSPSSCSSHFSPDCLFFLTGALHYFLHMKIMCEESWKQDSAQIWHHMETSSKMETYS